MGIRTYTTQGNRGFYGKPWKAEVVITEMRGNDGKLVQLAEMRFYPIEGEKNVIVWKERFFRRSDDDIAITMLNQTIRRLARTPRSLWPIDIRWSIFGQPFSLYWRVDWESQKEGENESNA